MWADWIMSAAPIFSVTKLLKGKIMFEMTSSLYRLVENEGGERRSTWTREGMVPVDYSLQVIHTTLICHWTDDV